VNFRESIPRSKSPVKIKLSLRGEHRKQRIYFSAESCSLAIAAITVIRKAFDYFINAEAAVFILKGDIQSARERNRQDLYNIYTSQMAELVKIISYEEIL
jgi:sulfur transfer complex TusBCD TusB component (DsrH family)